jgi:hypothetical protein
MLPTGESWCNRRKSSGIYCLVFVKYYIGLESNGVLRGERPGNNNLSYQTNSASYEVVKLIRWAFRRVISCWGFTPISNDGSDTAGRLQNSSSFFRATARRRPGPPRYWVHHTQWHITVGRTPLDERSARRRDLYLTTHTTLTRDRHPCPRRDSNPRSQQAIGRRPTALTAGPLG